MADDCLRETETDATTDQPETETMSSDEDLDFPVVSARHWYKCNVCHGYVHSIPILRYHYLDEHGMTLSSSPQINGNPPPGALEGKLHTSNWQPLEPTSVINTEEAASTSPASRPPEHDDEDEVSLIRVRNLKEVLEASSCSNNAEQQEKPAPSPTDSGIQNDEESEVQEDEFQQPLPPPPTDQNQLNSLDKTDNRNTTNNEQTISPTKTNSTNFSCTICSKPFNSPSQLNFHIRQKHKYQVVRGSPEKTNSTKETSPPKIVLKITKRAATGKATTPPAGDGNINSENTSSHRVASHESRSSSLGSGVTQTTTFVEAEDLENRSADTSTRSPSPPKRKRNSRPTSSPSSDFEISRPSRKKKKILPTSDADFESLPKTRLRLRQPINSPQTEETGITDKAIPSTSTARGRNSARRNKAVTISSDEEGGNDDDENPITRKGRKSSKRERKKKPTRKTKKYITSSESENKSDQECTTQNNEANPPTTDNYPSSPPQLSCYGGSDQEKVVEDPNVVIDGDSTKNSKNTDISNADDEEENAFSSSSSDSDLFIEIVKKNKKGKDVPKPKTLPV